MLGTALFVSVQSNERTREKGRLDRMQHDLLLARVAADACFLDGDHARAMDLYDSIARVTGDTSLLEQRRVFIMALAGNNDEEEHNRWHAQLESRLTKAEQLLNKYRRMENDLTKGRERLAMEERQLQEAFGGQIELQQQELERTRRELDARMLVKVIRFINAKKGTEVIYLGEVRNEMANGRGIGVFRTGSVYEGQWKDNKRHGIGDFTWPDGDRYVGSYVDDKRTGVGEYHWNNGQRWEGIWLDDMRHGEGVLYEADGRIRVKGVWAKDKLVETIKTPKAG